MDFISPNLAPALPEIFLLGMICVVIVADLFVDDQNRIITYLLAQASLLGTAVLTATYARVDEDDDNWDDDAD